MTVVFRGDGTVEALPRREAGPPARRGSADRASDGLAEFYAASFRGLATQVYVYTGDLGLAQELVQEAFCRALPRWAKLSIYDDPVAWVRRVAFNLANNRWQRGRVARRYLRGQRVRHVDGPSPDRVAAVAALAQLPAAQRRAMVLHYFADLPVAEIASQEGVAIGTVKLALALVGGPSVGLALANGDGARSPAGGTPPATTAGNRPSESPSAAASATPGRSSAPPAPDGRISLDELKRARLDLPPWPDVVTGACDKVGVDFIGRPAYSDVDHDGAQETAAVLRCATLGDLKVFKVVVFDRSADGAIRTLGQVLATPGADAKAGDVQTVWAVQAAAGGQIRVEVRDYFVCCAMPQDLPQHQWRTYGWDGRRFTQTGGPRAFGPNPKVTDLTVTANDLVMARQADGRWRGTLTVKVGNAGPFAAHAVVSLHGTALLSGTGAGWDGCHPVPVAIVSMDQVSTSCDLGTLAAGRSRTLSLTFTSPISPSGTLFAYVSHPSGTGEPYPDADDGNDKSRMAVRAG